MSSIPPPSPPTRLERSLVCRMRGLDLRFAGAGLELAAVGQWVAVVPTPEGRLRISVVDPGSRRIEADRARYERAAWGDFAPQAVQAEGGRLRCRASGSGEAPSTLDVELKSKLAEELTTWLPRLRGVATGAAQLVEAMRALDAPPSALSLCADVVAGVVLDGRAPEGAAAAAVRDRGIDDPPAWLAAFEEPSVQAHLLVHRQTWDAEAPGFDPCAGASSVPTRAPGAAGA